MAARTGFPAKPSDSERKVGSAKRIDDPLLFGKKLKDFSPKPVSWLLLLLLNLGRFTATLLTLPFRLLPRFKSQLSKIVHLLRRPTPSLLSLLTSLVSRLSSLVSRLLQFIGKATLHLFSAFFRFIFKIFPFFSNLSKSLFRVLSSIHLKKRYLFTPLFLFLIGFLSYQFYDQILKDLPQPNRLASRDQIVTTKIYDRKQRLLYKIYRNQNRTLVSLDEIPLTLQLATIAIEDSNFYNHRGFTLKGTLRAAYKTLILGQLQGGSTITQQLVKSTLLTPEQTLKRKIKELILAFQVETYFRKDEILQMYLNEVGYGGAAYGAEEASQMYFGKSVSQLNLAESALLAGLPAAPTRYSPFGAHPKLAKERQKEVLRRLTQEGYITEKEKEIAQAEKLVFKKPQTSLLAPHFVMYIKDLLVQEFGEKMVEEGGLEVTTSLDFNLQSITENIVQEELNLLKSLKVGNGAALVINPSTGEILAMVGSKDYFNLEEDGNVNVTLQPRQPGSAIKIVNYAYALSAGYTAASIIPDTPVTYKIPGSPPYSPANYDGRFHGPVSLRTALGSSYNVPAVKVLASYGVDKMLNLGQKMGISTWNEENRFGLSLTLGGGEVKMIDLAVAYGTLANTGKKVNLNPILEVRDYKGKILKKTINNQQLTINNQILNPGVAFILTDILSDNQARAPAFGQNSVLNIPNHPVAVKTGTTTNLRDNWTIGYTPDFLVAVWVGNNDNTPMSRIASGITGASPIWQKIIDHLLKNQNPTPFAQPPGLQKVAICSLNGLLPCQGCPTREEYFLAGTQPQTPCDPAQFQKDKKEKVPPEEKNPQDLILEGISIERE